MKLRYPKTAALLSFGAIALFLSACDSESTQHGYRGTSMINIVDPSDKAKLAASNEIPPPIAPVELAGPRSSDVFKNVQVLGDTSVAQLSRLMVAITQWVAPQQGCVYCHLADDYASDELYSKVVARRMLQMTRHINADWQDHVATTGVTCYTCHRGRSVPEYLWFAGSAMPETSGMARRRDGQNLADSQVTNSSLPHDPFSALLKDDQGEVKIISKTALPSGSVGARNATEETYALMIHMSQALGVNCLYCHNTRAFWDWKQSNPARVTAWYGIRMVRDLNQEYLGPLQSTFPAKRMGPNGDGPKVFCATCHQGVAKPLYGESMLGDYPSLVPAEQK